MILACHVADFFKSREKVLPKRGMVGLGGEKFPTTSSALEEGKVVHDWIYFKKFFYPLSYFHLYPPLSLWSLLLVYHVHFMFAWSHYWNQGSDCLSPNIHIPYMHQKFFLLKTLPINILKEGQQHVSDDK